MKTVEIVNTARGCYVTRRYGSQNKGREFFSFIAPDGMKKKDAKKFLADSAEAKEKYIKDWMGD